MSLHKIIKGRGEEFRKKFVNLMSIIIPKIEPYKLVERTPEVIDFNHQTSLAIIDGMIERLDGMKKKSNGECVIQDNREDNFKYKYVNTSINKGYNKALQDQISYLQAEKELLTKENI